MQQPNHKTHRQDYKKAESERHYNGDSGLSWGTAWKIFCVIVSVACLVGGFLIVLERRTTRLETIMEQKQQASPQPQPPTPAAPPEEEATNEPDIKKPTKSKRKKKPFNPQLSHGQSKPDQ